MDNRDQEDGPLVPVKRDAAYQRPVIESIDLETNDLGMRYVKIVKRPSDGNPILDVMFSKGLRLTVNIEEGMETSVISSSLLSQMQEYRPESWVELEDALSVVTRSAEKMLGGSDGKIIPFRFAEEFKPEREKELRLRWAESLFLLYLKKLKMIDRHPYELAVEVIREYYSTQ